MSSYSESDAVAKDFREALEDIQTIGRPEISNLTIIARENIEHALAISSALVDHIKRAAPHKKLPPLYVLDSIAKNVGTPYTLFFSRKLYQTYMDAYAMVDMATRRKLEEMLKTWKEPVPGSIDTRPVFPPEVVRPIENALIKVRTTTLQQDQERMRNQQQLYGRGRPMPGVPYRETSTPPGVRPPQVHAYPTQQPPVHHTNGITYNQSTQPPPISYQSPAPHPAVSRSTPQPPTLSAFQPPHMGGYGLAQRGISIDALNDDIQRLTAAFKGQLVQTPHDPIIQTKLKALMDLQTILQTQNLPQDQLVLVKNQIADLAVNIRAPPAQTSTPVPLPNPVAVAPPPAAAPKVSLDSLFGSGALAAIMARNSVTPQVPTPQPPAVPAPNRSPPPQRVEPQKAAPVSTDPMALMNMLRQAGILPPATPVTGPAPMPSTSATPSATLPFPLPIPTMTKSVQPAPPGTIESLTNDIVLKASSLKQFRPQLLPLLFEAQGPQCTQCGRRFPTTEEGKKRKTAHMDWHFKVNQRSAETEKRGQHRSWLVDEMDWINTRETIDKEHVVQPSDADAAQGNSTSKAPKVQYIPVPDDPVLAASVCPICQEKFETRWLDDAQEFVWADAVKVGDRIYHFSCHQEAFRDGGATPMYTRATPEPVLGKRKAEQDELVSTLRSRMKVEAA
ncbi:hypothetical protein F5Y19DRAFT_487646 [Xylariaceae sp. FL1651]|nr:hypothetical protein F5Y19DRAFT_487646 [Xylariaceae sp. FL1651]